MNEREEEEEKERINGVGEHVAVVENKS